MPKTKNKNFKKKQEELGYGTPDRFRKKTVANIKIPHTAQPRCLGGHR